MMLTMKLKICVVIALILTVASAEEKKSEKPASKTTKEHADATAKEDDIFPTSKVIETESNDKTESPLNTESQTPQAYGATPAGLTGGSGLPLGNAAALQQQNPSANRLSQQGFGLGSLNSLSDPLNIRDQLFPSLFGQQGLGGFSSPQSSYAGQSNPYGTQTANPFNNQGAAGAGNNLFNQQQGAGATFPQQGAQAGSTATPYGQSDQPVYQNPAGQSNVEYGEDNPFGRGANPFGQAGGQGNPFQSPFNPYSPSYQGGQSNQNQPGYNQQGYNPQEEQEHAGQGGEEPEQGYYPQQGGGYYDPQQGGGGEEQGGEYPGQYEGGPEGGEGGPYGQGGGGAGPGEENEADPRRFQQQIPLFNPFPGEFDPAEFQNPNQGGQYGNPYEQGGPQEGEGEDPNGQYYPYGQGGPEEGGQEGPEDHSEGPYGQYPNAPGGNYNPYGNQPYHGQEEAEEQPEEEYAGQGPQQFRPHRKTVSPSPVIPPARPKGGRRTVPKRQRIPQVPTSTDEYDPSLEAQGPSYPNNEGVYNSYANGNTRQRGTFPKAPQLQGNVASGQLGGASLHGIQENVPPKLPGYGKKAAREDDSNESNHGGSEPALSLTPEQLRQIVKSLPPGVLAQIIQTLARQPRNGQDNDKASNNKVTTDISTGQTIKPLYYQKPDADPEKQSRNQLSSISTSRFQDFVLPLEQIFGSKGVKKQDEEKATTLPEPPVYPSAELKNRGSSVHLLEPEFNDNKNSYKSAAKSAVISKVEEEPFYTGLGTARHTHPALFYRGKTT